MDLMHEYDEKDKLSGLPDEILLHILTFLPIKDAAKTALIRKFGGLWRGIPILDFDQCTYHVCHNGPYCNQHFLNLIHQVLKLNSSITLEKLRLKFHFYSGSNSILLEECAAEINSIIDYALSKKVKVIDLDFLGCGLFELIEDYTPPDEVFRSNYLTELRLAYCDVEYRGEISLKSLKILSLNGMDLNDDLIEKMLVGSPSLEDLSIIGCSSLTRLDCNANPNLRKLNLVLHMGKTLIISCSNLVSLEISGCVERARLV